jgi:hypothetical protein
LDRAGALEADRRVQRELGVEPPAVGIEQEDVAPVPHDGGRAVDLSDRRLAEDGSRLAKELLVGRRPVDPSPEPHPVGVREVLFPRRRDRVEHAFQPAITIDERYRQPR